MLVWEGFVFVIVLATGPSVFEDLLDDFLERCEDCILVQSHGARGCLEFGPPKAIVRLPEKISVEERLGALGDVIRKDVFLRRPVIPEEIVEHAEKHFAIHRLRNEGSYLVDLVRATVIS